MELFFGFPTLRANRKRTFVNYVLQQKVTKAEQMKDKVYFFMHRNDQVSIDSVNFVCYHLLLLLAF